MNDAPDIVMALRKGNTELSRDKRPIVQIFWPSDWARRYEEGYCVGDNKCTRIEAYDESGHMACIPWIAVISENKIIARIPAEQVSILYQ